MEKLSDIGLHLPISMKNRTVRILQARKYGKIVWYRSTSTHLYEKIEQSGYCKHVMYGKIVWYRTTSTHLYKKKNSPDTASTLYMAKLSDIGLHLPICTKNRTVRILQSRYVWQNCLISDYIYPFVQKIEQSGYCKHVSMAKLSDIGLHLPICMKNRTVRILQARKYDKIVWYRATSTHLYEK
jgi:hypothetical protein